MTWEMKVRDFKINDTSLLDPSQKEKLEGLVVSAFQKLKIKLKKLQLKKQKKYYDLIQVTLQLWCEEETDHECHESQDYRMKNSLLANC